VLTLCPSATSVDTLASHTNPALTFASLPRLSQVQLGLSFCENNNVFRIPSAASGTAAAPGLTSVLYKGQAACYLQQGSGLCNNIVTCP
jgi:hypothetical protein